MMRIRDTCSSRPAIGTAIARWLDSAAALEMSDARAADGWAYRALPLRIDARFLEAAIRQGDLPFGSTYRTRLAILELGRADLSVTHAASGIAVQFRCDTAAAYTWLLGRRHALECRLASAFSQPCQVEVTYAG